jgi:predicted pyridoxine 5'-phosphate oxidase superfamily flavin-nucleotide-binding protein
MKALTDEIVRFFQKQHFVIISTVDSNGIPHNSCKGIVKINKGGRIYLLDLYRWRTYANLKHNRHISITGVDEHKFKGWCLKGKAKIIGEKRLKPDIIKAWEARIANRITQRLLKNIKTEEKGHSRHPESQLPKPEYMIVMEIEEIVNLIPGHVK